MGGSESGDPVRARAAMDESIGPRSLSFETLAYA